jgi:hypothetical protein
MDIRWARLDDDATWENLRKEIAPRRDIESLNAILTQLRELGAKSVVIEARYYDRDFSAEFSAFYSKVFTPYSKSCRRFHFFNVDLSAVLAGAPTQIAAKLEEISEHHDYLGFIVVRPIEHAPIGRAVMGAPKSPPDSHSDILVRSRFDTHVLGATLSVVGAPFTQQDSRIAACAQASIWMACRHFFSRHGGPWISTADITDAASKPTDHVLSSALPAGSAGLTVDNMLRALRAAGREPLIYGAQFDQASQHFAWPAAMQPHTVIDRYIDSGIPVIIGLLPWQPNVTIWHAVTAVGHNVGAKLHPTSPSGTHTRADFCQYFLVNDDQRGIGLRMPLRPGLPHEQTPYSIKDVVYLIIPLPSKVYIPAESAERLAWDFLDRYCTEWPALRQAYQSKLGASAMMGDDFVQAKTGKKIVARTYLTYGWRYRQRMIKNTCSDTIKEVALKAHLPRYVWVTEFGTESSFSHVDGDAIRVLAHAVSDATSSNFEEARCIVHAPGFIWHWRHDGNAQPYARSVDVMYLISDDHAYKMKVRGK